MLTEDEVIEWFTALRQHQKDGKRSPHKPFFNAASVVAS
jgi:hypothetical protein